RGVGTATGALHLERRPELPPLRLGRRKEEVARRPVPRIDSRLLLEGEQLVPREKRQPNIDLGRELRTEPTGGALGTPAASVNDEDPPDPRAGQMVGDAPANHAATDDQDVPVHRKEQTSPGVVSATLRSRKPLEPGSFAAGLHR